MRPIDSTTFARASHERQNCTGEPVAPGAGWHGLARVFSFVPCWTKRREAFRSQFGLVGQRRSLAQPACDAVAVPSAAVPEMAATLDLPMPSCKSSGPVRHDRKASNRLPLNPQVAFGRETGKNFGSFQGKNLRGEPPRAIPSEGVPALTLEAGQEEPENLCSVGEVAGNGGLRQAMLQQELGCRRGMRERHGVC